MGLVGLVYAGWSMRKYKLYMSYKWLVIHKGDDGSRIGKFVHVHIHIELWVTVEMPEILISLAML